MAKTKSPKNPTYKTTQPTKEDMDKQPSFWDNIKNFFKSLKERWAEFWQDIFHPSQAVPTPEPRPYKPSDQIYREYEKFPGADELTMNEHGLVRLPPNTEKIAGWSLDEDAARYIDFLQQKFPQMLNPMETHDGAFITSIATDVRGKIRDGRDATSVYAIAGQLMTVSCKDGKCSIALTDGAKTTTEMVSSIDEASASVAKVFTEHMNHDKSSFFLDTQRDIGYLQRENDNGACESYRIQHHHRHINDYDKKVFIDHKHPLDGVLEIQGAGIVSRETIDKFFPVERAEEKSDFEAIVTAMHEPLFKDPGYQSTFVTSKAIYWLSHEGDKTMVNVAPAQCQYSEVTTISREVPAAALEFSNEGRRAFKTALQGAVKAMNKQVKALDELHKRVPDGIDEKDKPAPNQDKQPPQQPPEPDQTPPDAPQSDPEFDEDYIIDPSTFPDPNEIFDDVDEPEEVL